MAGDEIKSRRGVYRDLSKSPYEYKNPYGDCFKFSSAKKLEIYTRDITKELGRVEKVLEKTSLDTLLPTEIILLLYRTTYKAFYRKTVG